MFLVQVYGKGDNAYWGHGQKCGGHPRGQVVQDHEGQGYPQKGADECAGCRKNQGPGIFYSTCHPMPFPGQGKKQDKTDKG